MTSGQVPSFSLAGFSQLFHSEIILITGPVSWLRRGLSEYLVHCGYWNVSYYETIQVWDLPLARWVTSLSLSFLGYMMGILLYLISYNWSFELGWPIPYCKFSLCLGCVCVCVQVAGVEMVMKWLHVSESLVSKQTCWAGLTSTGSPMCPLLRSTKGEAWCGHRHTPIAVANCCNLQMSPPALMELLADLLQAFMSSLPASAPFLYCSLAEPSFGKLFKLSQSLPLF